MGHLQAHPAGPAALGTLHVIVNESLTVHPVGIQVVRRLGPVDFERQAAGVDWRASKL